MSAQNEFSPDRPDADILARILGKSDRVLVKKLSNNDRDWARYANKHQAGVYIPYEQRDSGFFPALKEKGRATPEAREIHEAFFPTVWPQTGSEEKLSRLVHYTSKGQETHMTGLPKAAFAELLPASFLVMGRISSGQEYRYECLTIDSDGDEALLLAELFDLNADFVIGIFEPREREASIRERILDFADQIISAWMKGDLATFAKNNAVMPSTLELATRAREVFLRRYGLTKTDPFELESPGDALREISRIIEWELFRDHQHRERAVELVRMVLGDRKVTITASEIIRKLVEALPQVDRMMLSASQQRKSRAGYSYEHHIEAMLSDGEIPFEKQVIVEARKRPDFVLPSLFFVDGKSPESRTGLILSAKTTLRERWKQVEREKGKRRLFLTTVDENIASSSIDDMASFGVYLVIPESLRESKATEYKHHENVVSFREFCTDVVRPNLDIWRAHI
ncbi:MAG: hypothetical protein KF765_03655 [Parvibaculaceae bacterium]|nr:hypothetical protein [Parvibaculaceae bacterium]